MRFGRAKKRRVTNAERFPFSPLYVCHAALTSHFNLRAVAGKLNGRAAENFSCLELQKPGLLKTL